MLSRKIFLRNAVLSYTSQGLNFLLPLLVIPYLIDTLSIEGFAKYGFSMAFAQICILFVDFGFNISTTKKIAELKHQKDEIKILFWKVILIKMVLLFFSVIIAIFIVNVIPAFQIYRNSIYFSLLMVLGTTFYPTWWFIGQNYIFVLSSIGMISKVLTYPMIFVLVTDSGDYNLAILIQSLSYVLSALLSFVYLSISCSDYFDGFLKFGPLSTYLEEIRDSWSIFLSNSAINLYTNFTILVLGGVATERSVGVFTAIDRILRVLSVAILAPLHQVVFPILAQMKLVNMVTARGVLRKVFLFVFFVICVVLILYFIFKKFVVNNFLDGFELESGLLDIYLFTLIPIAVGSLAGQLGLLGLGGLSEKRLFSSIYIWIALITFPVNFVLIWFFYELGAMISIISIETIVAIVMFYFVVNRRLI